MADTHVEGSAPAGADRSPSVTVVVPTRNAGRTLATCLASLRSQTYPCGAVVVDNGSTDATVAIAESGADVVPHAGPERSARRNHGARAYPAGVDPPVLSSVPEEAIAGSARRDGMAVSAMAPT